jgi:dihydrofolate reductase
MSHVILTEFLTLDGVMEAPGGEKTHPHAGWVGKFFSPDVGQFKLQETLDAESLLIGRVTYESFAGAWPARDGAFADKMNAMPKHVVSSTLKNPSWTNCQVVSSDLVTEVAKLKARAKGPILVPGSRSLAQALMALDLIDEYRFMVFPVILGSGKRLFRDTPDKQTLRLTASQAFSSGVVVNTFARAEQ